MSYSCAPTLVSERGIARSEQGVHDISRQTLTDSEAQARRRFPHRLRASVDSEAQANRRFRHRLRANVGANSSQRRTNGSHCDELFLRASAGVRTRHCTVRTRRARYLTANTYRLRGSSTSSLPAPPTRECWRRLEPTSKRTATTGISFCASASSGHRTVSKVQRRRSNLDVGSLLMHLQPPRRFCGTLRLRHHFRSASELQ